MAAPPKGLRVSAAQTTLLVELMEQHPYLTRGLWRLSPSMSAAQKKALWHDLTAALNALGPAVKTARRWRQYWARIVYDCKKLAAQVGSEKRKTGGGKLGGLGGGVIEALSRTGPGYAPVDFFQDDAEQASSSDEEAAASRVPLPTAPPHVSVGTEPGTSGTAPSSTTGGGAEGLPRGAAAAGGGDGGACGRRLPSSQPPCASLWLPSPKASASRLSHSAQAGSEETKSNILPCTVQTAVTVAVLLVDKCIKVTVATPAAANQPANSCCPEKWLQHSANDHNIVYPQLPSERLM
ncbi:hypothetical protein HPB49_003261 [Dermacentor silvarum]|uniref:Uncharacterized protein n=1 Tax=Dermacentor silvarum TaxID=543639 RepID=A0ACB8C0R9_DERSI|nr:hypothetical protein HPB49_003261 [Dermacentor silvarum]